MDDGPIVWKQTVTISCNWTPGNRMYGDMVVGEELGSLWSDAQYGEIVSLEGKVQFLIRLTYHIPCINRYINVSSWYDNARSA